ncbi:hypothetical protein BDF19DRAFT_413319 [Syncephalis fuscata]|nr:hypothetical protein BDF19DRAFT_413319 [Syncephalis fuscata]
MSAHNNDTLPKIWQTVNIVYHISMLSGITTTIALARTCKSLHNSIINYDSLWHKFYQNNFPCDINTNIDWSKWQLNQESKITGEATAAENKDTSMFTWFQLYIQRVNTELNWQKSKPTSTVHLKPFEIYKILALRISAKTIIASYPGWFAIASRSGLQIDLIEILPKNTAKIYLLDLDKNNLKTIKNITFYQYRLQTNDADESTCVILHLEYIGKSMDVLQIWNANSRQLLQSIDFDGEWDGRIIGGSLLFSKFKNIKSARLFYSNFSETRLCKPQLVNVSNIRNMNNFRIHTANSKEIILLSCTDRISTLYKIVRVSLTHDANSITTDYDTPQVTEITSGYLVLPNGSTVRRLKLYSISYDRILFYCSFYLTEVTSNGNIKNWQRYIKVVSLKRGAIFECSYSSDGFESLLLIAAHDLAVFYSRLRFELVIVSLLDGEIQQHINISILGDKIYEFQHLIDTKIIGFDYKTDRYCIIDTVTGDVNVYSFPVSKVECCAVALGHMLLITKEATLITSFVPKLM